MTIYLGADHGGFALKEKLKAALANEAYDVVDCGARVHVADDDYPDFGKEVGAMVAKNPETDRGILICRSGFGMDIVANKFPGVRAVLPMSPDHAYQARHDDNANVLVLAADFTDESLAQKMMTTFLSTPFAKEERYERRLEKISKLEIGK
jgi:RpiB/LacA/LacB family sugar-phosphate isomerase